MMLSSHIRWLSVLASVLMIALVAYAALRERAPEDVPVQTIVLTEAGFEPREITVPLGAEVRFTTDRDRPFWPASNLHPDHGIYPEFDPMRPLSPDEEWLFRFDRPGAWGFHDHIRSYYIGTITVTP